MLISCRFCIWCRLLLVLVLVLLIGVFLLSLLFYLDRLRFFCGLCGGDII